MDSISEQVKKACHTLKGLQPKDHAVGGHASEDDLMDASEIIGVGTVHQEANFRAEIQELFRNIDGGLYLYGFKQLNLTEMLDAIEELKVNAYWMNHYLPIASNSEDNTYLIVEPQGKLWSSGGLISWSIDEGVEETISPGLDSFLDSLVTDIQTQKVSFESGKGYVRHS